MAGRITPPGRESGPRPAIGSSYLRIPFVPEKRFPQALLEQARSIIDREYTAISRKISDLSDFVIIKAEEIASQASLTRAFEAAGKSLGRPVRDFDGLYGGDWKNSPFRTLTSFDLLCFSLAADPAKIFETIAAKSRQGLEFKGWGHKSSSFSDIYLLFSSEPAGVYPSEGKRALVKIPMGIAFKEVLAEHEKTSNWLDLKEDKDGEIKVTKKQITSVMFSAALAFPRVFPSTRKMAMIDPTQAQERIIFVNLVAMRKKGYLDAKEVEALFARISSEAGQGRAIEYLAKTRFLFIDMDKVSLLDDKEEVVFEFPLSGSDMNAIRENSDSSWSLEKGAKMGARLADEILNDLHRIDNFRTKGSPADLSALERMEREFERQFGISVKRDDPVRILEIDYYARGRLFNAFRPEDLFLIERTLLAAGPVLHGLLPRILLFRGVTPAITDRKHQDSFKLLIRPEHFLFSWEILEGLRWKQTRQPALDTVNGILAEGLFNEVLPFEARQKYFTLLIKRPDNLPDDFRRAFMTVRSNLPWFLSRGGAQLNTLFNKLPKAFAHAFLAHLKEQPEGQNQLSAFLESAARQAAAFKGYLGSEINMERDLDLGDLRGAARVRPARGETALVSRKISVELNLHQLLFLSKKDWEEGRILDRLARLKPEFKLTMLKKALKKISRGMVGETYVQNACEHAADILLSSDLSDYGQWLVDNRHLFKLVFGRPLSTLAFKLLALLFESLPARQLAILQRDGILPFQSRDELMRHFQIELAPEEKKVDELYASLPRREQIDLKNMLNAGLSHGLEDKSIRSWYGRIFDYLDRTENPRRAAQLIAGHGWYFYLFGQNTPGVNGPESVFRQVSRPFLLAELYQVAPNIYSWFAPQLGLSAALSLSVEELVSFYFTCQREKHPKGKIAEMVRAHLYESDDTARKSSFEFLWNYFQDAVSRIDLEKLNAHYLEGQRSVERLHLLELNARLEAKGAARFAGADLDKIVSPADRFTLAGKILGVSSKSSPSDVQKLFRRLAQLFHPDVAKGDPEGSARTFSAFEKAYDAWMRFHAEHLAEKKS